MALTWGVSIREARSSRSHVSESDLVRNLVGMPSGPGAVKPYRESMVAPILCYCIASILMTVVNKFVVSGAHFSMTFLLLAIQSLVGVACVALAKATGIISFRSFALKDAKVRRSTKNVESSQLSTIPKAWFSVSFMLTSVIYTGSKVFIRVCIPVYTIFKNLTIILIAYGEVMWFGGRVTRLSLLSFGFMVFSSVIAAWDDVSGALADSMPSASSGISPTSLQTMKSVVNNLNIGYFWMFVNCFSSAAYVLLMRKKIKITGFSDWDSMFYNNLLSIPILAVFSLVFEDWKRESIALNFPQQSRHVLLSAIAFSGAAAVGISYTTAWCVRATSSTTYSMVGALNKLPVAASGMVFFGDPVTLGSVSAISVGFFAGLIYAIAKSSQRGLDDRSRTIIPLTIRK
ncbi:GDP-mannose transporter [Mycena indigotica]|uniref:GDP-mannose transporter n=1 Tax=Mycena indigotica TaxID=2126181 RepID=A0A8H6WCC2_9AGAR|nr:GDP-mannose transporter [Mycena indigotica]KAF7309603.1 GDP-mannose transporter [Mycena indigotica]